MLASTLVRRRSALADGVVNIYTYRQPELIKPVLDAFTAETGIKTEVLFLDKGLEERIAAEGAELAGRRDHDRRHRPPDHRQGEGHHPAARSTRPSTSNLPAEYRDPEGHWFGVTKRARVVYASKDRVKDTAITYADLADPKWKGKICMRSGQHDYNLALFSAAIAHWGAEKTEEWMKGLKANLAQASPTAATVRRPGAIFAGECDIALGNTYYVGLMRTNEKDPKEKEWGNAINVIFPTFENGGTHVNISGAALAKNAPNRDNAVKLIEFLAEPQGAADLCRAELRISGRAGPRAVGDGEVVRRAEGRHAAAGRHRQEPQGGVRDGRPRRPRRRPEQLSAPSGRQTLGPRRARRADMTRLALPADGTARRRSPPPQGRRPLRRQAAAPSAAARGGLRARRARAAAGRRRSPMWRCRAPARTGRISCATCCRARAVTTLALLVMVAPATAIVGVATAWLVVAFDFPLRRTLSWALVLPLAVPPYLAAYAFGEFFHYSGPVQGLVRALFGFADHARLLVSRTSARRRAARSCCPSVLYPYVYLTTRIVFLMQGRNIADVARTLGARPAKVFLRVLLPVARPAIVAGVALVLMETINDIGAAEYLGVRTLTFSVYTTWLNRGSLEGGAQIALVDAGRWCSCCSAPSNGRGGGSASTTGARRT